ncbi:MAG: FG-GAP-like repeat-containing protein [Gammaproteobacteria bacterium]
MKKLSIINLKLIAVVVAFGIHPSLGLANLVPILEHTELWAEDDAVAVADICTIDWDGDGSVEIISLATTGVSGQYHAELRVANWNKGVFNVRAVRRWSVEGSTTRARAVYCGDVDGDGVVEILTATEAEPNRMELKVWTWLPGIGRLIVETGRVWEDFGVNELAVGDVDGDGTVEVIVGGDGSSPLRIVRVDESGFVDVHEESWQIGREGIKALTIGDINADGSTEIVTASAALASDDIEVRVWRWNGSVMNLEASHHWHTLISSNVTDAAIGNFDADTFLEVVLVGRARDSSPHPYFGLVSLWQWNGDRLEVEAYQSWQSTNGNIEFLGTHVADVDLDGVDDIVVAGVLHEIPAMNVFRIYSMDDQSLVANYDKEWIAPEMVYNFAYTVHAADVDGDGGMEIITGGRGATVDDKINLEIDIWGFRKDELPWFLLRLKNIFSYEGWPFYLALRETLPLPWPWMVYTVGLISIGGLIVLGYQRLLSFFKWH